MSAIKLDSCHRLVDMPGATLIDIKPRPPWTAKIALSDISEEAYGIQFHRRSSGDRIDALIKSARARDLVMPGRAH